MGTIRGLVRYIGKGIFAVICVMAFSDWMYFASNFINAPRISVTVWGDRVPEPVPIPAGRELILFALRGSGRVSEIRDVTVRYRGPGFRLVPDERFHTEITVSDEGPVEYALRFNEKFTLAAGRSVGLGVRYELEASSEPVALTIEGYAKVAEWDIDSFTGMFAPRERKFSRTISYLPVGYGKLSADEISERYGLKQIGIAFFRGEATGFLHAFESKERLPVALNGVELLQISLGKIIRIVWMDGWPVVPLLNAIREKFISAWPRTVAFSISRWIARTYFTN